MMACNKPSRSLKRTVSTPTPASLATWLIVIFVSPFVRKYILRTLLRCQGGVRIEKGQMVLQYPFFICPSLTADNIPVRFTFGRPTQTGHRGLNFAWVVRFELEDALDWGERTRSSTVRTFHQGDGTFSPPFEIDGNHHSRKRAFG